MINKYPKLFNINPSFLKLNLQSSGPISDYLYNIVFNFYYFDIPIEKAHLSFHLNNGGVVQIGQEFICDSIFDLDPNAKIKLSEAWDILWNYIGGKNTNDEIIENGKLSIVPVSTEEVLKGNLVQAGSGLKYKLVYTISFVREGIIGTWEAKIDAHTGEILSFRDINSYGHIQGGTCIGVINNNSCQESTMPFPFADYGNGLYADSKGDFDGNEGTSKLKGKYVEITDSCGDISLSATDGIIDFGISPEPDCITPGKGGPGNTRAARTQYWNLTNMMLKASKYLPNYVSEKVLYVKTNISPLCQSGALLWQTLFYKSISGSCQNSGEFPGIGFHEFGHILDIATSDDVQIHTLPKEATADIISILELRDSCPGNGYLNHKCGGYGDPCSNCLYWREADFGKHESHTAWTAQNYRKEEGGEGVWGPCKNGGGPCGLEVHCESGIATQAFWDLVYREFTKYMDLPSAWQLAERLFYNALSSITYMYTCNPNNSPVETDGCDPGSLYHALRNADDDDGNLDNGTPHAAEIFNALSSHNIACEDYNNNNSSSCPELSTPYLNGFSASGQNNLYWEPIENATRYIVYRNEVGCNIGFTKVAEVVNSCYADIDIYPGVIYYYRIQAVSNSSACESRVSNCIVLQATHQEGACPIPGPPKLTKAEGLCDGIKLTWEPWQCGNSIRYNIYKKEGDCGGEFTKIAGPINGRTYTDTNVSGGINYSYKIKATCDTEGLIESAFSNCLTSQKLSKPKIPNPPTLTDECNGIKVLWQETEGATKYNVFRRDGGCGSDGWQKIASNIEGTEYLDTNASPGLNYGYYIEAVNDCGTSSDKNRCSSATHASPDISGIVKEIVYDKTKVPTPPPTIRYVKDAIIEDLTGQIDYNALTNENGFYIFTDVQGSTYNLQAYVIWVIDNAEYRIYYNPLPYRIVSVCKEDVPNQDFWKEVWVVPFDGRIMGSIQIGGIFKNWTVSAFSSQYFDSTFTDIQGNYILHLPEGTYKVSARKDCYVSYPPYITQTVSDSPVSNINFQIIDWNICNACYSTLYREQKDCGLLIDPEQCLNNSIIKFKQCILQKTADANSSLYNAIILSVEVQRAKGKPQWQDYQFQVQEEGDYLVNITNGDLFNQETACSSAEINLQGYGNLFGPNDFNKNVFELKKQIHLLPGNYELNAILRSQPGCYITIVISNKDIFSFEELP